MLALFAFDKESSILQNAFDGLLSLIRKNMAEIWKYNSEEKIKQEILSQSTINGTLGNMGIGKPAESGQYQGM